MRFLVVFESMFGNTEIVARARPRTRRARGRRSEAESARRPAYGNGSDHP